MKKVVVAVVLLLLAGALVAGCDSSTGPEENGGTAERLYVKFENSGASAFPITEVQLMPMGPAGSAPDEPSGEWGENVLPADTRLAPGEHIFLTLPIPNLHWSQYRLGVVDEEGNQLMLHRQPGYSEDAMLGSITHWGSHERTVEVTVARDQSSGLIVISGWSDFAGIE